MGASKQLWEQAQDDLRARANSNDQRYLEHKHYDKPKEMADSNLGDIREAFDAAVTGEADAVSVAIAIRSVRDEADRLLKDLAPTLESALDKYPKRSAEMNGWRVSATQGAAEYRYDNNPEWVELKDKIKVIEDQMKVAANNLDKGMVTGTVDGEEVIPAVKTHKKDSIKFEAPRGNK